MSCSLPDFVVASATSRISSKCSSSHSPNAARPARALEQERRRALHAVVHDRRLHAARRVQQLHAAVVGGDERALGGRHRDVELALGVLAVDEQRARDPERDLGDAGEVLDVARQLGGIQRVGADVLERGAGLLAQELAAGRGGLVGVVVGLARDGDALGGGCGGHAGVPTPLRRLRTGGRAAAALRRLVGLSRGRSARPGASGGSPSQAGGRSRSTCVTSVCSRGRPLARARARARSRHLPRGLLRRRVGRLGPARGAHARAGGHERGGGEQREEDAPLDADGRGPLVDVGLVEQPPDDQRERPRAGGRDDEAVAARQVEGLALRPRPDEEQHRERDQQDRRLDPGEDLQRRARVRDRVAAPEERDLVPGQEQRERPARAAAPPVMRDSGGSERSVAPRRGLMRSASPMPPAGTYSIGMSWTSTGASGSRSRRAIHQSISARSASSSSRAASASWRASSGGTDVRAASSSPASACRSPKAERSPCARSPSKPRGRDARRRARARRAVGLAHEPVGGGVGRVDLRAHLRERVGLSH